jgi:hypothetical protein
LRIEEHEKLDIEYIESSINSLKTELQSNLKYLKSIIIEQTSMQKVYL